MDKKIIGIVGQTNRYLVKKAMCVDKTPKRLKCSFQEDYYLQENQQKILDQLLCHDEANGKCLMYSNFMRKINGYKAQDTLKKKYRAESFIKPLWVLESLNNVKLECFYCNTKMLLIHEFVRDMRQWTLDRIDNNLGHITDNVVHCCLACNLRRRRQNHASFLFTKQMTIVKEDVN